MERVFCLTCMQETWCRVIRHFDYIQWICSICGKEADSESIIEDEEILE